MDWHARIRAALSTPAITPDDDVVEELAQHARATYDAARADGCSPEDAGALVTAAIARWRQDAATLRHRRPARLPAVAAPPAASSSWMAGLAQDVRYALRLLRRQPRVAMLVVLTMALGIGPSTVLFSVAHGVLLKPLPWEQTGRLVVLEETRGGRTARFGSFSNAAYLAWRDAAATLEDLAAWSARTVTLTDGGEPERIRVTSSTASLFRVLGVRPLAGSLFDDAGETERVVVLAEGLWRRRFGGDPALLGRAIALDGEPYTVVGIVADDVVYPDRVSRAWIPFRVPPPTGNLLSMFEAVGKLRPDATVEQAAAEGTGRGRFAAETGLTTIAIFGSQGAIAISARPFADALTADVRRPLIVLLGAVGLLLALATTNVASLQLARATTRRRELAIRAAVGAGTGRVVRQLVVESLVLGALGGAAGLALAWTLHRAAIGLLPSNFPRLHELALDGTAVAMAIAISLAASLAFALLPARRLRRLNLVTSLAEDGTSPAGIGTRAAVARSRLLIIGGQVAIACVLLVGASLLGRSFFALLHADRGFDPARVVGAAAPMAGPGFTPARRVAVLRAATERLRHVPGVAHAAFAAEGPLTAGGSTSSLTLPARDGSGVVSVQASPRLVSPGYFETLGLRVLIGRVLAESDTPTSQPVAVVNETFARRYLGASPLDARIPMGVWGRAPSGDAAIVGVVEDVRYIGADVTSLPEMYFSSQQIAAGMQSTVGTVLARGDLPPAALAGAMRAALHEADSAIVPTAVMTLEDRLLVTSLARPRLYAALLGIFAALAVAVTGVGLFGVLSYLVAQRTRELALRAALGASRGALAALVLRQGLAVAGAGVAVGLIVSAWLARFLASLLFGVTATDPVTYIGVPVVLLVVATAACLVPALRASHLDPLRALRS